MTTRVQAFALVMLTVVSTPANYAQEQAAQKDSSSVQSVEDQSDGEKKLIANAFGEPLYLEQVTPKSAKVKQAELPADEFAEWLHLYRGRRIYQVIWGRAVTRYAQQNGIGVSDDEMKEIAAFVDRRIAAEPEPPFATTLTPDQRKGVMIAWTRASLMDWKVCRSLHAKYGGRVGIGSLGAWTAFDAQNELLSEHEKAGDIEFHDTEMEKAFRDHTKRSNFADAYPNGERLKKLLAIPPHLRQ